MRGEMQSMTAEVRRLEREEETAFNYLHLASFSALLRASAVKAVADTLIRGCFFLAGSDTQWRHQISRITVASQPRSVCAKRKRWSVTALTSTTRS
jgi:hypothetical protein